MKIGIPKEIKNHEYRVGMIPAAVHALVQSGHSVVVEQGAGLGSGIGDEIHGGGSQPAAHRRRHLGSDEVQR